MLQKHFHTQEESMDKWPFWLFEENIKLVNEITEEEQTNREKQEESQSSQMGNFNADSMMKSAQNMTNNIPKM